MNSVAILLTILFIVAILGTVLGNTDIQKRLFFRSRNKGYIQRQKPRTTIYIAVKSESSKVVLEKPKVYKPAERLAKDIEIVTDGKIVAESWRGYRYREILARLTPQQINDINEMRSFLK
jgi:hypothetical protein